MFLLFYINTLDALFIVLWFFVLTTKFIKTKDMSRFLETIAHLIVTIIILVPGFIYNSLGQEVENLISNNYYYNLFLYNFLPIFIFLFLK